jgi:hypothetical protein
LASKWSADSALTTGAILIASGRVPNIAKTFNFAYSYYFSVFSKFNRNRQAFFSR